MDRPRSHIARIGLVILAVGVIAVPSALLGASLNGAGLNDAGLNGAGLNGAGLNRAGQDDAGRRPVSPAADERGAAAATPEAEAAAPAAARSVILLIGDGMGDSEITIARNYQVGAAGRLALDGLPHTGAYTTYSVQKAKPSLPDYATDSAAAATAWATGHKTYDGAIAVLPSGRPVPTLLELARRAGYRTGSVTTAELEDATPAALAAHVVSRTCKGPAEMKACPRNAKERGGAGSIAEQLAASKIDVLLGGGKRYFDQTVKAGPYRGKRVTDEARARGYRIVTRATGLASVPVSAPAPLLGLFAEGNLAQRWVGPKPTRSGTAPARCRSNRAAPGREPRLVDLANRALAVLEARTAGAPRGFFLQIEGASIDKRSHGADPCGQIGETVEFDAAVRTALRYRTARPDTLVIVTGDHGQAAQLVDAGTRTLGYTATLRTKDGANLTVSYATAKPPASQKHTGTQLRIAAAGPLSERVQGVHDQTAVFDLVTTALGLG